MDLLYRWIDSGKGWKATTFEKEISTISSFHEIEEAKKKLVNREMLLCGVRLLRLYDGVK
ncbi:hypothetical protein ES695_05530 [Candidatus Atribacteria bacterium 1244-E10-H5-B2]|nr:MAG: hypothetical protein ES695_05530 [Candidatus Atribacteria bacterium 1244-E10-H5-B2]